MANAPNKRTPTSLADYARHRGCSRSSVTEAIQEGRLRNSVEMVRGKPTIRDVALADREWLENTRSTDRRLRALDDAGIPPLAVSRARLEAARAGLATMELLEKKGKLVSVEGVRQAVTEKFTAVKTKLMGLPVRIKQRLPHIDADDVRVIDNMVREALEDLAGGAQ